MSSNVKFRYLYRDAGNYKRWGDVVFSNLEGLEIDSISRTLTRAFMQDGLFVAHQIRVSEVFLFAEEGATSDDHCFHEFDAVEVTTALPNDRYARSIKRFIAEVNRQAATGWRAFDPHDKSTRV